MDKAIIIQNLVKDFPGTRALSGVSFSVEKGSIHGFLGPNGAGKSTTMRIITGLMPSTSGEVTVDGRIGFLAENPPLYLNMTVRDYLQFVLEIHSQNFKPIYKIDSAIEKCGLGSVEKRLIGNLSKGFKQRVGIAQTLVHNPEIIILDEPTVGLDPKALVEIRNLILSLRGDHTVLLSSHQLNEVSLLCSHISIINSGEIIKSGPLKEMRKTFKGQQVIEITVDRWDPSIDQKLIKQFDLAKVEWDNEADQPLLRLYSRSTNDIRPELARFMLDNERHLYGIQQVETNLEDMFNQMTR
ncbi:MAG: ABC transporter ATP-binding protein [Halobacteriovoraceae bacterium]|jgi:ABC-2 type transport system ATP-binding protein|nr:ABC transporter ATP-binding protein [Halobacteriovoraceae bacterium]MBT5095638.1 ABC transporter ATP-binding protein [Halobacteriovoraceae bacterium]